MKILGFLYSHNNKKEQAYNYLKKVTEIQPSDHEAWIELAQLIEDNSTEALKAYERGRQIMEGKSLSLTPEIWNNIGVLRYMQGLLPEAEEAYLKAIQISGNEITDYALANITTIYNLARLKEYQPNIRKITSGFSNLSKNFIGFIMLACFCHKNSYSISSINITWITLKHTPIMVKRNFQIFLLLFLKVKILNYEFF